MRNRMGQQAPPPRIRWPVVFIVGALLTALGIYLSSCATQRDNTARLLDSYRIFWASACEAPAEDMTGPCARAERDLIAVEPALEDYLAAHRGWRQAWTFVQPYAEPIARQLLARGLALITVWTGTI